MPEMDFALEGTGAGISVFGDWCCSPCHVEGLVVVLQCV